ncbi:hypothetical protein BDR06DRAFT_954061 [Suillus hirtellus]|nr:hypothetical protein BDR06DRAFT_954061 [Suillus hirtellus]
MTLYSTKIITKNLDKSQLVELNKFEGLERLESIRVTSGHSGQELGAQHSTTSSTHHLLVDKQENRSGC